MLCVPSTRSSSTAAIGKLTLVPLAGMVTRVGTKAAATLLLTSSTCSGVVPAVARETVP